MKRKMGDPENNPNTEICSWTLSVDISNFFFGRFTSIPTPAKEHTSVTSVAKGLDLHQI